jgi:primosomal protein N' (replication factor Y)
MLLGPAPAPFSKVSNLYRYHLIFKGKNSQVIQKALSQFMEIYTKSKAVSYHVDVDPVSLM